MVKCLPNLMKMYARVSFYRVHRVKAWLTDAYTDGRTELRLLKEWVSFFLGSWDMNRSAEQTNRVNREAVLVRFVCSALRVISHEPRKKDTHSLYLQCLQQRPLLKFSEQSKKFKFPAEIGHLTLFPDKTIIAYSFRQNSAWINGEKVVCCECFHTLKQY